MAGYGVAYAQETRINQPRRPRVACHQCEDTGFVQTSAGLKECPKCENAVEHTLRECD